MVLSYLSPQRAERPRDFLKCATRSAKQTCTTSSACWNPVLFNGENFLKNLLKNRIDLYGGCAITG